MSASLKFAEDHSLYKLDLQLQLLNLTGCSDPLQINNASARYLTHS